MIEYKYKGWIATWSDSQPGIAITHEPCDMALYTGDTIELGWGHCSRCKAPLTIPIMRHLMNAYEFLKVS